MTGSAHTAHMAVCPHGWKEISHGPSQRKQLGPVTSPLSDVEVHNINSENYYCSLLLVGEMEVEAAVFCGSSDPSIFSGLAETSPADVELLAGALPLLAPPIPALLAFDCVLARLGIVIILR